MKRIAIDMDDTLADTLSAQITWFRERFGYRWTKADLVGKELFGGVAAPEHQAEFEALMAEGSFFGDLEVLPGAVDAVRRLAERYEVYVASSATPIPGSMLPKLRWLDRHFPFVPTSRVVFCGDKDILDVDVLIDDSAYKFPGFRGRVILFDAVHNRHLSGYERAASWADVERSLL